MKKRLARALGMLGQGAMVVLLLLLTAPLLLPRGAGEVPRILGVSHLVVMSGSMAPAIEAGDLIIIKEQEHYQVGDIITFSQGRSLITHRVVGEEAGQWVTRGDANNTADTAPVDPQQVVGKMLLRLPKAGHVILFLQRPYGLALLLTLLVALTWLTYTKGRNQG